VAVVAGPECDVGAAATCCLGAADGHESKAPASGEVAGLSDGLV